MAGSVVTTGLGGAIGAARIPHREEIVFVEWAGRISVFDAATRSVREIGAGWSEPEGIAVAPDGTTLYVTERGGEVLKVDLGAAERSNATTIVGGLDAPHQPVLSADGSTLFLVEFGSAGRLLRVDLASNEIIVISSGLDRAIGLALSPDGEKAFVTEQAAEGGRLTQINISTGERSVLLNGLVAPFFLSWADGRPDGEGGNIADGRHLLLVERDPANQLSEIDLSSLPVVRRKIERVGFRPSSVVPLNGQLYVFADRELFEVRYMVPRLISRIAIEPASPRPAESVRVEIFSQDKPFHETDLKATINGLPGAIQYFQFPSVGPRRLVVRATAPDGEFEQQVVFLNVEGEPLNFPASGNRQDKAMIGVTQSATHPYQAVLTLGSFIDTRSPAVLSLNPTNPPQLIEHLNALQVGERFSGRSVLERAMNENVEGMARVETRRLTPQRFRIPKRLNRESLEQVNTKPRLLRSAIYDLTHVDLREVMGNITAAQERRFEWDFGDGTTETTASPIVTHDYFAAIDHAGGTGQFVVSCRVAHADVTVKRSLTIQSAYSMCKQTGTIVPHVTNEIFAHKRHTMFNGAFTVYNVEEEPMVLNRLSITETSDNSDAVALPAPFLELEKPITIGGRTSTTIGVNIPFVLEGPKAGQLRYDVKGFSVLYAGSCGDFPVRCSAAFDIPVAEWDQKPQLKIPRIPDLHRKPWPWEMVVDDINKLVNPVDEVVRPGGVIFDQVTGTIAVSHGALQNGHTASQARAQATQVLSSVYAAIDNQILEGGKLSMPMGVHSLRAPIVGSFSASARALSLRLADGEIGRSFQTLSHEMGPPPPGPIAAGQICDPDNLTEEDLAQADSGQLVCQLTDEVMEVMMPARWMNGRKGDVILSPGGDGIIGGLMLNVNPPQWYSHCGIMTRNYDEITHSTGSQKRLMDNMVGFKKSDGFEPRVLKYVWPGAITQSVQHSIEGEDFPDPEFGKTYSISSFGKHTVGITHNDQMKMIPPLVLKPDPMQETPAIRTELHAIATNARNAGGRPGINSKYHYRWYCYTDPSIGRGTPEGPEAGWAAGTLPSVCSSFVWLKATERNAHLETDQALVTPTDLEAEDIQQGAMVRPTTPNGLYTYSAEERKKAADWLYETIYNQAYDKAGWFGVALTDGADDIANQFINVFANDNADGKDSTDWQNQAPADAVSPDNMLWWDSPAAGGLYGYAEPAIYREPRIESYQVSRWKKVLSRGTIKGRVLGEGGGTVAGVLVQAYEGKFTFSGNDGSFTLTEVPVGHYSIKASKVIDGIMYSAQVPVNLNVAELVVNIQLQPPADRYRIAQIFIDFWGRDEEVGKDEIHDPGPEYFEMELGPDKMINSTRRTYKWGGELRVEYDITVRLLVNNTIDVAVQGTLFEGTAENEDQNKDLDGQGGLSFQTAVGQTTGATLTITNTDEDDSDAGILSISVKNVRNNN